MCGPSERRSPDPAAGDRDRAATACAGPALDHESIAAPEAASLNRATRTTTRRGPSNQLAFTASLAAASSFPPGAGFTRSTSSRRQPLRPRAPWTARRSRACVGASVRIASLARHRPKSAVAGSGERDLAVTPVTRHAWLARDARGVPHRTHSAIWLIDICLPAWCSSVNDRIVGAFEQADDFT